ncbi:MAG: RDD family protein [Streptococcaceae bacterium]|jgi:uncharacterized RDD family membrane protein YckC|nr:RDD family protein [Streptococcaceae bacterium]
MKGLFFVQRVLAALIDLIIVYLPVLFSAIILFKISNLSIANLLAAVLFAAYNVIATASFNGRTVGKYFAKLQVAASSKSAMDLGQREAAKILYFLPFVGPLFMLLSVIFYIANGRFLHDWIGRSQVKVYES